MIVFRTATHARMHAQTHTHTHTSADVTENNLPDMKVQGGGGRKYPQPQPERVAALAAMQHPLPHCCQGVGYGRAIANNNKISDK